MTPADLEHYAFYRLYSIDLNTVRSCLRVLRRYRRRDVRNCLLRDIVVGYARPFSQNRGHLHPKHVLRAKGIVPPRLRRLHEELLRLRQELFAHTNYDRYKPQIAKWVLPGGNRFPMGFSAFDYGALDRKLPSIEALISEVEAAINTAVTALEADL